MQIHRAGDRPSRSQPAAHFTGAVRADPVVDAAAPSRLKSAVVTFEPGARTHWHSHPLGQTLLILSGLGRVARRGGGVEEVRPGDVVVFAPGEVHWHGAAPDCAMAHLAMVEAEDGASVDWMMEVTGAEYLGTEKEE